MKGSTIRGSSQVKSDRMIMMTAAQAKRSCGRIYGLAFPLLPLLLLLLLLLLLRIDGGVGGKTTTIVRHTDTVEPHLDGFWTNRTTWNARWVKYWRAKRIYEPVWKKVWTPTILNEWVPLPNAPPPDAWQQPEDKQDKQQLHSS
ncbi:uncharacterized protein [Drosophila virilis]|uniref:Uncharacterized protein n=1 Tax=Drosophila virilis TaxID=7244 RepID=B4LN70_DROVI|nr:uncharacterized protein LOC6624862 [Drosophila virilis]EDW60074.2 uncharacterized protein Dvir_GJ21284 [Drosophila virilis]